MKCGRGGYFFGQVKGEKSFYIIYRIGEHRINQWIFLKSILGGRFNTDLSIFFLLKV